MRRAAPLVLFAAGILVAAATPAGAYFEDVATGARGIALGPAALGIVDDASAYYWNPAALADLKQAEVLVDYAKPYGIPDLNSGALALAGRRFSTGWAVAWHRLGIAQVYSEDLFCLAAGRRVFETAGGHALAAGATYKFGRIAFQPFDNPDTGTSLDLGSQAKGSFDVALKWTTPWILDFSGVVRDVIEPRYQMVPGTGGDLQAARAELGTAIHWNKESTISFGWSQFDHNSASFNAGLEILFFDVFAIRSGLANLSRVYQSYGSPTQLQYVGGFGVYHRDYFVDAGVTTNRDLGASYRITLRVPIGGDKAR